MNITKMCFIDHLVEYGVLFASVDVVTSGRREVGSSALLLKGA